MSKFTEKVREDTPRLIVKYKLIDGRDEFEWGTTQGVPMLSLIGGIFRSQVELHASEHCRSDGNLCPESMFVLAWDLVQKRFDWFVHPSIPVDSLIGMLETVRSAVVLGMQARRAVAQAHTILGPDGRPALIH